MLVNAFCMGMTCGYAVEYTALSDDELVNAFCMGMTCGYAVEYTALSDDERVYENRYRAFLQGKINNMSRRNQSE